MSLVEELRYRLAEIDAFANAADEMFRQIPWVIHRRHRRDLGRLTHLMSDAAHAAHAAIYETDLRLTTLLKRGRRVARVEKRSDP